MTQVRAPALQPAGGPRVDADGAGPARPSLLLREALVLGVLLLVYQASRLLGGRDTAAAFENARTLLDVQERLGLPSERHLQDVLMAAQPVLTAAHAYYAAAHLPVTALALVWLLRARPRIYRRARTALFTATGAALVVYVLLPVAPPRMLPGYVDTAAALGQSVYGDPATSTLTNQFAAMPSLHVGWALLVALACCRAAGTRWRFLWLLHPLLTVLVVVGTANHYWVDAAAAVALVLASWALAQRTAAGHGQRAPEPGRGADAAVRQVTT